ncbi:MULTISPECIES: site-specific DNA-methyltransferase [Bacillaceae]|uniref:Site-specific DNA-methyltransferase n=1 Tax=Evansella alkalicola TaxID=745819 RepID=A0ABS6JYG1_9BACI|nr:MULTISPECIES: site-specific DNA-methyltransferase [Bacillaceae]MBU9723638.1 site-specific DNA-methyltransferase [Bacillus alkalicola]
MDKLKMQSTNKVAENVKKIAELFPNTLTEVIRGYREDGSQIVERAIDFEMLRQELSDVLVEGPEERYQFTWPDKKKSVLLANSPINKTLRPYREESVDFEETKNLYIEGDNLDALKLLQETYLGKVKIIYIDPPYNTGKDFIYEDDFEQLEKDYIASSGQLDLEGNRLVTNIESNGRFHTDWLNMLYPRLKLAKDLLSDDGVIFISIDDNEVENLKKVCNELFGSRNFVASIIWERAFSPVNLKKHFSENHDYILCYAKNLDILECNGLKRSIETDNRYKNPDNDPRGPWTSSDMTVGPEIKEKLYEIKTPSGNVVKPASGRCWLFTKERYLEMLEDNRIWFGTKGNNMPRVKKFLSEVKQGVTPMTIWKYSEVGHSQDAQQQLKQLFDGKAYFDYPKSVNLIKRIVELYSNQDSIILDFFAGSSTTAHAVMQLNSEDNGNRKFIMVQIPEETDEKSDAYAAGYKNICDIGKERIRRAGKKLSKEDTDLNSKKVDFGFRVLKVDTTNMQDVYYSPIEYKQGELFKLEENIKLDRTPGDLLFQVMLDLGVLLSSKIEETFIKDKKVFDIEKGYLLACFDTDVTSEVITEIAKKQPYYAVFRDSSIANDSVATNFEQIFENYSPTTIRKVL